ncbi:hypothetical protein HLK59_11315 [Streptomyces sp. S3(2020)]|uniref:hypothetical protein n=1 Tax=Streptomyces sp. S3(2020) TaxID=2732044 RepID=UPI00148989DB|nr:hypothetical protein [Streptomyces sp. S3(2020)]NNN30947.1 hypothetical protein [Streptomyces sp. S3(2020)]
MDEGVDPARESAAWTDGVLERLVAQDDLDADLLAALGRSPTLREETLTRMAEAVRAAALGLGPAGCAVAAGVPERLLRNWQAHNPSFAAAMAAASTLARLHTPGGNGKPAPLTPAALRVLLRAVRAGARHAPAAEAAGVTLNALNGLRRQHPTLNALILAARRARPKRGDRRGVSAFEHRYRLVRVDDTAPETPSPPQRGSRAEEL